VLNDLKWGAGKIRMGRGSRTKKPKTTPLRTAAWDVGDTRLGRVKTAHLPGKKTRYNEVRSTRSNTPSISEVRKIEPTLKGGKTGGNQKQSLRV